MKTLPIIISFQFLFFLHSISFAQENGTKINLQLNEYISNAAANEVLPLLIEAKSERIEEDIYKNNAQIIHQIGKLYSIRIKVENIRNFAQSNELKHIEFRIAQPQLLNDTMLINNNIIKVHQGKAPLYQGRKGKGVIVGIIDTGIDFSHPDFKDSLGNSRVLAIWDQNKINASNTPAKYGYGQAWNKAQIDANLCTHDDPANEYGHGTMVSGAAVGNGLATGNFKGVAPEADIVVVASNLSGNSFSASIVDAIDYIYSIADSAGKPCVINISLGDYGGSHDGKDIGSKMIDSIIKAKNGRAIVAANGNAGDIKFHLGYQVNNDTNFTWFKTTPPSFYRRLYFRLYADTADFNRVHYAIGADQITPNYKFRARTSFKNIQQNLNTYVNDTIFSPYNNKAIAKIQYYAEEKDGVYLLEVLMSNPDSADYNFRFETTGSGKFDIWTSSSLFSLASDMISTNLPSSSQFPDIINYKKPDSLQTMVGGFTCLPSVISVGNYQNRKTYTDVTNTFRTVPGKAGKIQENSSLGPNRLGHNKPDISASGGYTFAAGRLATIQQFITAVPHKISQDSMHMLNGGTSMSSPVVAGIVALYLEKCPHANYSDILQSVINNAKTDNFTGAVPNPTYGYGKVDAFMMLSTSIQKPLVSPGSNSQLCDGDSLIISLIPNSYASFKWSNNDSNGITIVKNSANFYAEVEDSKGCKSYSDTASYTFNPLPPKPYLFQNLDTLYTPQTANYNWYKDGFKILGAIDSFYVPKASGNFWTRRINSSTQCGINSDTIYYTATDLQHLLEKNTPIHIYPNPAKDLFYLTNPKASHQIIEIYNTYGQLIEKKFNSPYNILSINTSAYKRAVYFINIIQGEERIVQKIVVE